jgi:hypothetical protein
MRFRDWHFDHEHRMIIAVGGVHLQRLQNFMSFAAEFDVGLNVRRSADACA